MTAMVVCNMIWWVTLHQSVCLPMPSTGLPISYPLTKSTAFPVHQLSHATSDLDLPGERPDNNVELKLGRMGSSSLPSESDSPFRFLDRKKRQISLHLKEPTPDSDALGYSAPYRFLEADNGRKIPHPSPPPSRTTRHWSTGYTTSHFHRRGNSGKADLDTPYRFLDLRKRNTTFKLPSVNLTHLTRGSPDFV
ncbi:hypothetical protein RvY_04654 [Ramazzottius varieornatus]|uniref:Uncharacterized protein n=1 Tax=Ramazzottius varieornatus TaxID=947166 RepID=A0A1D1UZ20_RAMVA|nr:hypothetical protein RvY_04654 [Ramazzottius varieornatus]